MALLKTDPISFRFDVATGELVVTDTLQFSSGGTGVAQAIRHRLRLVKGEWFANLDAGVPYYEDVLGQKFDEARVRAAFRDEILAAPGVKELTSIVAVYDGPTRTVTVTWEVETEFGDTVADSLAVVA